MSRQFGLRKEQWLREQWPSIRARGFSRYMLVRGLVSWGAVMAIAVGVMITLTLGVDHPRLPLLLATAVPLCAAGGLLWAALSWWINERLFRSLTSE